MMRRIAIVAAVVSSIMIAREAPATSYGPYVVFYDFGSSDLTPHAKEILDNFVLAWGMTTAAAVEIHGYSDHRGTMELNRRLSCERAAVVRDYLVAHGIPMNRIYFAGFGSSRPLVDEPKTELDHQMNRRAELQVPPLESLAAGMAEQQRRCPSKGSARS